MKTEPMETEQFCCDKFKLQTTKSPPQFEQSEGTWNVNGCCGGGCYVITDMKFCPYCGATLRGKNKHGQ